MDRSIKQMAEAVKTRQEFVSFVVALEENYRDSKGEWENTDLPQFLNGLVSFIEGAQGYYKFWRQDVDADQPSWRVFADALLAARVRE